MIASLARACALVIFAAALGFAVNAARPGGLSVSAFAPPVMCDEEAGPPDEVAPEEAAGMCGRSDVIVADARPASRFAEGHVAGAVHLPCDAAGAVAQAAMSRFSGARTVIVYGENTDDAKPVAASLRRRLHDAGARVAVLRGGFTAWSTAGQACASGPCDDCKAEVQR